jgi:hypothetical protein
MPDEIEDIERDVDFELLLAEKRHKELMAAFTNLGAKILSSSADEKILNALSKLTQSIEQFILKQKAPVVNVENNQQEIVSSVDSMNQSILSGIAELKSLVERSVEKKTWNVEVQRDRFSYIDKLVFTQK